MKAKIISIPVNTPAKTGNTLFIRLTIDTINKH